MVLLYHGYLETISILLTIIGVIATFVTTFMGLVTSREKRILPKPKVDFEGDKEILLKGLEQQTLDENALWLIYKQSNVKKKESVSFVSFLESFLYHIRKIDNDGGLTKEASKIIYPIIEKEKAEKPYTNVNDRERRLLLAIEDSVNDAEKKTVKNHLKDLSIAIEEKQNELDKSKKTNRWSIPASILGSLLTLFFGLYSIRSQHQEIEKDYSNQKTKEISVVQVDSLQQVSDSTVSFD